MFGFARMDEHAELVGAMADSLGVDLAEEMLAGRMPPEEARSMVLRCIGCADVAECRHFLADHVAAHDAAAAPDYCRNKALMDGLKAR